MELAGIKSIVIFQANPSTLIGLRMDTTT